jgi:hypothetical protein
VPKVTLKFIEHWNGCRGKTFDINKPEDILAAGDIYQDLLDLKSSCENLVKEVEAQYKNLSEESQLVLQSAKKYYKNFNFLDCNLLLESLKANCNPTKPT